MTVSNPDTLARMAVAEVFLAARAGDGQKPERFDQDMFSAVYWRTVGRWEGPLVDASMDGRAAEQLVAVGLSDRNHCFLTLADSAGVVYIQRGVVLSFLRLYRSCGHSRSIGRSGW